ncbi:MAG TPA: HD domain-containing phosphohydrolase [Gemmatimonadaceae bacterium]|nr:HD domain-containing phosphohydrolase [Gemmatimonadaceae bacterium]
MPLSTAELCPDTAPSEPLRCLVVDDEQRLRRALVQLMRGDGFTCFEAGSGGEALALLEQEPVALVLSDLRMPGMDGRALLQQMRERHPDVAVIMLSAVGDAETAVGCLALGAMDYLTKPFVYEEVRARAMQALEKRRLLTENRAYREQLEARVAAQARRIEELFLGSIRALVETLEIKDPYTRGHSARVSFYAAALARALGLAPDVVQQVELGGYLHDIGKIGVREAVLNKEGPLTPEEYEHVMTHPVLGWRILTPILADQHAVLNIVRSHHEQMDGSGIPDGLRGTEIPLEARIASVADAFDAMMSRRPYRRGRSRADATAELQERSGTQFDPDVVAAFLKLAEQGVIDRVEARRDPVTCLTGKLVPG